MADGNATPTTEKTGRDGGQRPFERLIHPGTVDSAPLSA